MKKTHNHLTLSKRTCAAPGCEKPLKLRVVEIKAAHNATHCYKHTSLSTQAAGLAGRRALVVLDPPAAGG